MGFGDYPAGESPFGHDPVAAPPGTRRAMPRAARYDAATRSFLFEADGQLADVHPVDQIVSLALTVVAGSITSDRALGSTLRSLTIDAQSKMQHAARLEVERALAPQIAAGDVTIQSVTVTSGRPRWRVGVTVQYMNNREPPVTPRTLKVNA